MIKIDIAFNIFILVDNYNIYITLVNYNLYSNV